MLSQYLLTFYRSIARHKLYAAINILGLAVGIAVFLVLSLVVRFETSFERWIPDAGQIYAIETYAPALHLPPSNASVGEMVEALHADYPQIIATRVREFGGAVRQGGAITSEQVTEVDPTFFRVFDLPLVAGDKAHMLHSPDDVVITETKARRYFGTSSPIGQSITLDYNDKARVYRVVGVIKDPPATTDFNFDFLVPVIIPSPSELPAWRSWGNVMLQTYMRLSAPGTRPRWTPILTASSTDTPAINSAPMFLIPSCISAPYPCWKIICSRRLGWPWWMRSARWAC